MDVTLAAAAFAGLVSFLSPCVLPLLPPYLCYLAGTTLDDLVSEEGPPPLVQRRILGAAALFVAGFATVFVALGATASLLAQTVMQTRIGFFGLVQPVPLLTVLGWVAGIAIIAMGLHFLGVFRLALLHRDVRFHGPPPSTTWGAYVMGLAFAFGWTPCIGPVLAAILAVAASEETLLRGVSLLAAYSAGLGLPFLLAAFAVRPFLNNAARFRRYLPAVEKGMGGLLVLTGVLFLSGAVTRASFWLLETFPALGRLG
jgi:cytochrome c-type biogenesis protein